MKLNGAPLKIHKIELTKEEILSLPENERVFLVYAGHALNELNVLCRMIVFSMPIRRGEGERQLMVGQSQLLIRLLAGKLHEIWVMFGKTFYKSKLAASMECNLSEAGTTALVNLKRYFAKTGASVTAVRHAHAFHYDLEQVDQGLAKLGPKMALDIYFDETSANTFYGFADNILNSAVVAKIDSQDHAKAFKTLLFDTEDVSKSFQQVLEDVMSVIIKLRLGHRFVSSNVVHEEVLSTEWRKCTLPTFVENPGPWTVTLQNGKVLTWGGQRVEGPELLRKLLDD